MIKSDSNPNTIFHNPILHPLMPIKQNNADSEFTSLHIKLPNALAQQGNLEWFNGSCFSLTLAVNAFGSYTAKTNTFDVSPGTFFFSRPNTFRKIEWSDTTEIHHIAFSERFLAKYAGVALFTSFPFLLLETVTPKPVSKEMLNDLQKIYVQINNEHFGNCPFKKNIVANLLTRLLLQIKRIFWDGYDTKFNKNIEHDIVTRFIKNLEEHSQHLQQGKAAIQLRVKDYAKMQGIHENYLYTVIKARTGKMVSHWITEKTVFIAQNLLENPLLSIKEISYKLGFPYISYFTIFFKKHTGFTPKDFRKNSMA
ncbi:helix-turn-helix transcriptional regulator [Flavobacterium zepuense]|uniref:Helix-turn-helix transcriptional regulator n=1 Tax=Flavobacterium zepuense TaxID=2593302 RepID=A0A552V9W4_9FLAO|nr:AraC family transcriptional regulator [Flavobacterium zepuense]TRW27262.1 helix-turn-helix transcriptional regulator [Flavobacterium zepuense]